MFGCICTIIALVMPTKRKTTTTKKTNVDLNEILENISASIDSLAHKENIIREATSITARRVEEIEAGVGAWKVTVLIFSVISIISLLATLLK
jgi:hypothetical protein